MKSNRDNILDMAKSAVEMDMTKEQFLANVKPIYLNEMTLAFQYHTDIKNFHNQEKLKHA